MKYISSLTVALIATTIFSGCGGDDSSSSASVSFPSDASVAQVNTQSTAEDVTEALFDDSSNSSSSLLSISKHSSVSIKNIIDQSISFAKENHSNSYSLNQTYSNTEQCLSGGSIKSSMNGSEEAYTTTIVADNCNSGDGTILDGTMKIDVSGYDEESWEYKNQSIVYTTDFKTTVYSDVITISKGSNIDISRTFDGEEIDTEDLTTSLIVDINGEMRGVKDLKIHNQYKYSDLEYYFYKSGSIYIDNLNSYVTINEDYDASQTPYGEYNNGVYGSAEFFGAEKSTIVIIQDDYSSYASSYTVTVDEDNDGVIDNTFTVD